jgi:hypothetical protein
MSHDIPCRLLRFSLTVLGNDPASAPSSLTSKHLRATRSPPEFHTMASVTQFHKPQPLLQEDFRHGCLKLMSYSMEDVSKAVVNHLSVQSSEHNLTPIQKSALERYRYGGTWNLGQPNSTQNIKKFFDFFNEVYFNGILTGFGSLELLSPENMIKRRGYTVHAFTELFMPGVEKDPRYKLKTPKAIIIIENLDANEERVQKA